jgi:hypothetical protein
MGKVKFGYSGGSDNKFVDYSVIAVSSIDSDYPSSNLKNYWSISRAARSTTIASAWTIDLDLLTAMAPVLCLDHCNFSSVTVHGNSSNSWGSPAYSSSAITISMDYATGRYRAWIDCAGHSYQYWRIEIAAQTPTDSAAYFQLGRLVVLNPANIVTATYNIAHGYEQEALSSIAINQFDDSDYGSREVVYLSDIVQWRGKISWGTRPESGMNELWAVNRLLQRGLVVFYENRSDTSKFWLCHRDEGDGLSQSIDDPGLASSGEISLIEVV